MKRLVLGTAQLGMPYGIANRTGQPDQAAAEEILGAAWQGGIREIDTAQAYGRSEQTIGDALTALGIGDRVRIISKLHPELDHRNVQDLEKALVRSLRVLNIQRLYAVMLHRESALDLWDSGLKEIMFKLMEAGFTENIGISVYSPEKAVQALQTRGIQFVQVPSNVLDRRFEDSGVFRLAEEEQKHVYVRSIFLQGLLLMPVRELPEAMGWARSTLEHLTRLSRSAGASKRDLAMGYVKRAYPNAKVVIGVETLGQLEENIQSWQRHAPESLIRQVRETFYGISEQILNPGLWTHNTRIS